MSKINDIRKILSKFKIAVTNVIPSDDYKAAKIVTTTKNYKYSRKLLQELVGFADRQHILFSLSVPNSNYVDLIIYSDEALIETSMLSTVDISNVSKILKKENQFHYENTEDSDLFHIFHSDKKPLYSSTLKSLLQLYKKNKVEFFVYADNKLKHLMLSYPKNIKKEESVLKYDRIIAKAKKSIEKANFNINDNLLCLSYQELIDTVVSNLGTENISASQIEREFKEVLNLKLQTARHSLRTNLNNILQEIKK